ncbi:dihydroorotate dehydrogenase electron transfer subunit [Clostridium ganghwense]|uniref:Dihydroorotate dehydrogenase B (NAD(+)), electron transfer subunit n=1 Tax=Clostridium ganghwense TaxID=312089 RepID=A0ABT4CKX2_9CLOT|nr:dihydroorotate dehydrogenase electron transfer subunit [Clostridium ganghwense]MCY6369682.1 dihydroorotate dehydrogenase electron transfer subunit [Clostridium ganghwense]
MICTQELVIENKEISSEIFKLKVKGNFEAKPGQFYMVKCWEDGPFLPRPISVHDVEEDGITFLYAVVGKGTKLFSKLKVNDKIQIIGPLGNGFDKEKIKGKVAVVSGGIGIAPLNYLIKELKECEIDLYCGFRDEVYGVGSLNKYTNNVKISTENGSVGHKGYVTELLKPEEYDMVICCGPEVMMQKVAKMCLDKDVEVYVSMENRMACGIGACLVCTCKTKDGNKRTCKDGPVFNGRDLVLDA